MEELNKILINEISGFRESGHDFLDGKITRMEFKGISGGMGVYAHRNGKDFAIRFKIPSGITSIKDLKLICNFAKRYDLKCIHLTTRQDIQLHGVSIDAVCDMMEEGIRNGLYTRGGGGNFPRNVAMSPLSGVDKKEAFDVSLYALAVGKHFLNKIYTYKLPRKIKVAFSSSSEDLGHATISDLGFLAVKENGKKYFRVYIGGGLGRNPKVAIKYPELINPNEVLYYVEAMTKLFINEGDYKNKAKARIRYIAERMGKEEFIKCYNKYLLEVKQTEKLDLEIDEVSCSKKGESTSIKSSRIVSQKQEGLYSVYVHPVGGQLMLKDLENIINETEKIEDAEIRLSMSEGFYIRNLNGSEAEKLLKETEHIGGTMRLEYSTSCIGVPTCQIGILNSQDTLKGILDYFKKMNFNHDVLPSIHISGCPNSCSVHEASGIGFCGKRKRVENEAKDAFELHVGGILQSDDTRLGDYYGDVLREKVPEFLYELALNVYESGKEFYTYIKENKNDVDKIINKYLI
ncbi:MULTISPECIES: nitrite/sulfite reductase [Clostridium]|uniref:nitrite/sulfite reductase n=1 Tax=Clostridium TaxID=1485 RepID=UPI0008242EE8|nr:MULTISPECIES: nitrite/sulfite reductase [Clostridium]PJI08290.1 ferredoxin--nitrite reductase [Clostridium sp. CT7]